MSDPYWKSEREWVCPKHLPSVKLPANVSRCFFSGCSSIRPEKSQENIKETVKCRVVSPTPPMKKSIEPSVEEEGMVCAWFKCTKGVNGTRAKVRPNSKYCSRDCSNRNARWRHKQRKKT